MSNETDLDWLARNVHEWPSGEHQPWCYVYMAYGGVMKAAGNFLDAVANPAMVTKDQWLARRAELQNKPSWGSAPEWAAYLSQNSSGEWWWHGDEPTEHSSLYYSSCGKNVVQCKGEVLGDWRDTLERRPEGFRQFIGIEDNQEQDMTQQQQVKRDGGWFERGELPPVGARCVALLGIAPKANCEVIAKTEQQMAVKWEENGMMDVIDLDAHAAFRPILTERDVLIDLLGLPRWFADRTLREELADAILAAGFSLGSK